MQASDGKVSVIDNLAYAMRVAILTNKMLHDNVVDKVFNPLLGRSQGVVIVKPINLHLLKINLIVAKDSMRINV